MMIPLEAIKKVVPVVEQLSHEIVMGGNDWETVIYFQRMLETKSIRFLLAEIAIEIRKKDATTIKWCKIVETLEDIDGNETIRVPSKILTRPALQQDVADMLSIPRDDEKKLNTFMEIMRESYEETSPHNFDLMVALVDSYKKGNEQEILTLKPLIRTRVITLLNRWLKETMTSLGPVPSMTSKRKRDRKEMQGQLQGLKRASRHLRSTVVVDPLEEARDVAKLARGAQLYTKKISAQRLDFGDDEIQESDEETRGTHQLSEVPVKVAPVRPKNEENETPVVSSPGGAKHKRWTKQQKIAFQAALKDYGVGSWANIRDAPLYRKYWEGKSNVQLKDLYRTMKERGELSDDLL